MLGVSPAYASSPTNKDIADATAQVLIPWYGVLMNLLAGYDLYTKLKDSGCSNITIIKELVFFISVLLVAFSAIMFFFFPFIIAAVISILWMVFVLPFLIEANEEYALEQCKKD